MRLDQRIQNLLDDYKKGLLAIYGNHLAAVLLFGSYARGEEDEESDVDIAIILRSMESHGREIDRTSLLNSNLSLRYGVSVSRVFLSSDTWNSDIHSFANTIRAEAVAV